MRPKAHRERSNHSTVSYVVAVAAPLAFWLIIAVSSGGNLALPALAVIAIGLGTGLLAFTLLPTNPAGWLLVLSSLAELWVFSTWAGILGRVGGAVFVGSAAGSIFGYQIRKAFYRARLHAHGKSEPDSGASGWHVGEDSYPSGLAALKETKLAIAHLNGRDRHIVTLWKEYARIDIVGSFGAGLVVYCSPNSRSENDWSLLLEGEQADTEIEVQMGPDIARLPRNNVVSSAHANRALDGFVSYLGPDPELAWLDGQEAFDRRPSRA